jgi:hypothetical protein
MTTLMIVAIAIFLWRMSLMGKMNFRFFKKHSQEIQNPNRSKGGV